MKFCKDCKNYLEPYDHYPCYLCYSVTQKIGVNQEIDRELTQGRKRLDKFSPVKRKGKGKYLLGRWGGLE